MPYFLRTLALLLSLGLALVSCGSDEEEPAPTTATPVVEKAPAPQRPAGLEKKLKARPGKSAKLSELETQVPKDVPLYPEAYSGFVVENTGNDLVVVMQSTGAGVANAVDYYVEAIAEQGWDLESETLHETNGEIVAFKNNKRMTVLTVTNGQETLVSVKVQPQKKR